LTDPAEMLNVGEMETVSALKNVLKIWLTVIDTPGLTWVIGSNSFCVLVYGGLVGGGSILTVPVMRTFCPWAYPAVALVISTGLLEVGVFVKLVDGKLRAPFKIDTLPVSEN